MMLVDGMQIYCHPVVQEILFDGFVILCCLATGIACAIYAERWTYPPSPCSHNDERTSNCDSIALAAIAVMQAVS